MPEPRSEVEHHRIILKYLVRHLHILEEQRAKAGMLVPPYVIINIEDVREGVATHRRIIEDLENPHLLSGLCICLHCGSKLDDFLLRRKQAGGWDHIRPFYMCSKSFDGRSCENEPIDAGILDASVFQEIIKFFLTESRVNELAEKVNELARTGEPPLEIVPTRVKEEIEEMIGQPGEWLLKQRTGSRLHLKELLKGVVDKVEVSSEPRVGHLYFKRP